MTTPKEALERARTYVAAAPGSNAQNTLQMIDEALASLQREDAVERVAQVLLDRFIERSKCRSLSGRTFRDTKITELPASYRDDFEADARAILATGLVPDEAAIRADEREKQIERDAQIAEACFIQSAEETEHSLACKDIAAAIRSGGGE